MAVWIVVLTLHFCHSFFVPKPGSGRLKTRDKKIEGRKMKENEDIQKEATRPFN
jgi:hypothetical protein